MAVTFLSVDVPAPAARILLQDRADEFGRLLTDLGPDRDLVDLEDPLPDDWSGWMLMRALRRPEGRVHVRAPVPAAALTPIQTDPRR